MLRDLRETPLYEEIAEFCRVVRRPGEEQISDCLQMQVSPDCRDVVFTALLAETVDTEPRSRLALTDLETGETRFIAVGAGNDRWPHFSPDGRHVAFLSDRSSAGAFQLHLLDMLTGEVLAAGAPNVRAEWLQWSPDGASILVGAIGSDPEGDALPAWMPSVEPEERERDRRGLWLYDVRAATLREVPVAGSVWSAAWRGTRELVLLASDRSGEDHWYEATLRLFDLKSGTQRELYVAQDQLGAPVVSPSGEMVVAVVEALCSDRGPVTGALKLIYDDQGCCRTPDTAGVDVQSLVWSSGDDLLVSGYRGLETVVGRYRLSADLFEVLWTSGAASITGACFAPLDAPVACVMIVEGFASAPSIVTLRDGNTRTVRSFDAGYAAAMAGLGAVEPLRWRAPDGLEIEGWLLRPAGAAAPGPLVVDVHGGPIGHWRPAFLARRLLHVPALLRRGCAVLLPNPRGSTGRGDAFARAVMGDLGGADAEDLLAGIEMLIARGDVDPARVGVTGVSYGGFMAAWLNCRSDRFAATVSVSPHTNQLTAQWLSNIPSFMARLIGGDPGDPESRYFSRSPALRVRKGMAPMLSICGALDRCTPPEEAVQFHQAMLDKGNRSALVNYPRSGHGIRETPAALDCATRVVDWFVSHLSIS